MKEHQKTKNILKQTLKWIVTIIAVGYVFSKIDIREFGQQIRQAHPFYLSLALISFIISKIISSVRLNIYFKNTGVLLTELQNLKLYILGMFYNLFLPGGIGGDGYKIWLLHRKRNTSVKKLTFAVLIDRINGMLAILILLLILICYLPIPKWYRYAVPIMITAGYGTYILIIRRFFPLFSKSTHITTFYSAGVQLMQCLSIFFIMQAIGLQENYLAWMSVFMISSIVAVIPFTIGGLGAREIVFLFCSEWLQIDGSIAVTISLLFYAITMITSLSGIYYNLNPQKINI